ncbi:hypothetical protein KKG08_01655 [Patescibacteria group bacterium]|nr:hypothetical protein [Patescibacteria group bacterium]
MEKREMENVKGAVRQHKMKFVWIVVLIATVALIAAIINAQVQAGKIETKCSAIGEGTPFYSLEKGIYQDLKTGAKWSLLDGTASISHEGSYEKPDIPNACTSAVEDIKVLVDYIFIDSTGIVHHAEYAIGYCVEGCEQLPLQ